MQIYDIIMLIVLVGAMLFGAIKGFAWQLASISSIVVSYIVAYKYREPFSQSIQADPPWNRFLAMLILYVGTSLLIWVVFRMVHGTIDRMRLREFDRQVGALFGLAKGALYCSLITLFAVTLLGDRVRETVVRSRSGHYIARVLDRSQAVIPPELHQVVQPYLEKFDRRLQDSEPSGQADSWLAGQDQRRPLPAAPNRIGWAADESLRPTPQPTGGPSYQPLPIDPSRQWTPAVPPRQASQPTWPNSGFRR